MGHSTSRPNARAAGGDGGDGDSPPLPSRFSRFRTCLRLRRRDRACAAGDSGMPAAAVVAADEFAGIARIRIVKVRRIVSTQCASRSPRRSPGVGFRAGGTANWRF